MTFQALILAGSRGGVDPVAEYAGVADKAMIVVHGRTMLAHVVGVLRTVGATRILVSASTEAVSAHARSLGVEVIAAAGGPSESAGDALRQMGAPLLVTTADHALLQPEWIAGFLAGIDAATDVAILLARRETIERELPQTKRTYLRFSDGDWSGCNLFHLATPAAAAAVDLWQVVERDRKKPWRIVRRLGPSLLLRYLLGRLPLSTALSHLGGLAKVRVQVVESPDARAAVDVDKPADLDLVRALDV